jgi:hypothetical protein
MSKNTKPKVRFDSLQVGTTFERDGWVYRKLPYTDDGAGRAEFVLPPEDRAHLIGKRCSFNRAYLVSPK